MGDAGSLEAIISVIPKEGKDESLCSSYRPISLLNIDLKIFSKILAIRMENVMQDMVHTDQVGFIIGRQGRDNGIRTLLVIEEIRKSGAPGLLLSIDAEKAFDRVDWGFMQHTLESMGFGPRIRGWVRSLYNRPIARVKVNGTLSELFEMKNGTRQGCPLSPMLFTLALEPLLRTIRQNSDIKGLISGGEEHKIAAYADDILFYVMNPRTTLPN